MPLTVIDKKLEAQQRQTAPGMAHWSGSGPKDKTCRECVFWQFERFYSQSGKHGGAPMPANCKKYTNLMNGKRGNKVPHHKLACKYFEQNEKPPLIRDKSC